MMLGDSTAWSTRFISVDERVLQRIATVWPTCLSILPLDPPEDAITINLVHLLGKDPVVRRICHWIEFQFEPFGTSSSGAKFSKGRIDLAVLLDWERERYLAYECKRLNVIYSGTRNSLAGTYVSDGMMRFMTEQYAETLPVGCMLGYVLDGDTPFAMAQLSKAITSHGPLGLTLGPVPNTSIQNVWRFVTTHARSTGAAIEIRHALLPFPLAAPASALSAMLGTTHH